MSFSADSQGMVGGVKFSEIHNILRDRPLSWEDFLAVLVTREEHVRLESFRQEFYQAAPAGFLYCPDFISLSTPKQTALIKLQLVVVVNDRHGSRNLNHHISHHFNVISTDEEKLWYGRNWELLGKSLRKLPELFCLHPYGSDVEEARPSCKTLSFDYFFQNEGFIEGSVYNKLKYFVNLCSGFCSTFAAFKFASLLLNKDEKDFFSKEKDVFVAKITSASHIFQVTNDNVALCHEWQEELKLDVKPFINPGGGSLSQPVICGIPQTQHIVLAKKVLKSMGMPLSWKSFFIELEKEQTVVDRQAFQDTFCKTVIPGILSTQNFISLDTPWYTGLLKLELTVMVTERLKKGKFAKASHHFLQVSSIEEQLQFGRDNVSLAKSISDLPDIFTFAPDQSTVSVKPGVGDKHELFFSHENDSKASAIHKLKYFLFLCRGHIILRSAFEFVHCQTTAAERKHLVKNTKVGFVEVLKTLPDSFHVTENMVSLAADGKMAVNPCTKSTSAEHGEQGSKTTDQREEITEAFYQTEENDMQPLIPTEKVNITPTPTEEASTSPATTDASNGSRQFVSTVAGTSLVWQLPCHPVIQTTHNGSSSSKSFSINNDSSLPPLSNKPAETKRKRNRSKKSKSSGCSDKDNVLPDGKEDMTLPFMQDRNKTYSSSKDLAGEDVSTNALISSTVESSSSSLLSTGGASSSVNHRNEEIPTSNGSKDISQSSQSSFLLCSGGASSSASCKTEDVNDREIPTTVNGQEGSSNDAVVSSNVGSLSSLSSSLSSSINTEGSVLPTPSMEVPKATKRRMRRRRGKKRTSSSANRDAQNPTDEEGRKKQDMSSSKENLSSSNVGSLSSQSSSVLSQDGSHSSTNRSPEASEHPESKDSCSPARTATVKNSVILQFIKNDVTLATIIARIRESERPIVSVTCCSECLVVIHWSGSGFIVPVPKAGFEIAGEHISARWSTLWSFFQDPKIVVVTFDCESAGRFLLERLDLQLFTVFDVKTAVQVTSAHSAGGEVKCNTVNELSTSLGLPGLVDQQIIGEMRVWDNGQYVMLEAREIVDAVRDAALLVPGIYTSMFEKLCRLEAMTELHNCTKSKLQSIYMGQVDSLMGLQNKLVGSDYSQTPSDYNQRPSDYIQRPSSGSTSTSRSTDSPLSSQEGLLSQVYHTETTSSVQSGNQNSMESSSAGHGQYASNTRTVTPLYHSNSSESLHGVPSSLLEWTNMSSLPTGDGSSRSHYLENGNSSNCQRQPPLVNGRGFLMPSEATGSSRDAVSATDNAMTGLMSHPGHLRSEYIGKTSTSRLADSPPSSQEGLLSQAYHTEATSSVQSGIQNSVESTSASHGQYASNTETVTPLHSCNPSEPLQGVPSSQLDWANMSSLPTGDGNSRSQYLGNSNTLNSQRQPPLVNGRGLLMSSEEALGTSQDAVSTTGNAKTGLLSHSDHLRPLHDPHNNIPQQKDLPRDASGLHDKTPLEGDRMAGKETEVFMLCKADEGNIIPVPVQEAGNYDCNLSGLTKELVQEYSAKNTESIDHLLSLLGSDITATLGSYLQEHYNLEKLTEISLDLGRHAEARFHQTCKNEKSAVVTASSKVITADDLKQIEDHEALTGFDDDNRCGVEGTLHSVRGLQNRKKKLIGMTICIGLPLLGCADMMYDIAQSGKSTLILGYPGVGKTTLLRELARCLSSNEKRKVVVVDTFNEIAGDCDTPHFSIGSSRRLQVDKPEHQHTFLLESARNHSPEVIIIDQIESREDVSAVTRLSKSGIQIIVGTSRGSILSLIRDENLSQIFQRGMRKLDDAESSDSASSLHRTKIIPVFQAVIEMKESDCWYVHDLNHTYSSIIDNQPYFVQERKRIIPDNIWLGQQILVKEKAVHI